MLNATINYDRLKTAVKAHEALIKEDLGVSSKVKVHAHKTPTKEGVFGEMKYMYVYNLYDQRLRDVNEHNVFLYPCNIKKSFLHLLSDKDMGSIVTEALAHELRHVHQSLNDIGNHKVLLEMSNIVPYKQRPKEVDARAHAKKYVERMG